MATPKRARSPGPASRCLPTAPGPNFPGPEADNPLARRGYSRDGRRGKLQIVFALLCDREGRPVAAEVFEGKPLWRRLIGTMRSNWSTLRG